MNKKILLTIVLCAFNLLSYAQKNNDQDNLFVQEVPKLAMHKSYIIEDAINYGMAGIQVLPLTSDFLSSTMEYMPTLTYARVRKTGFYAKLGANADVQSFSMGAIFKAGKYFRPYIGLGMMFHTAWYDLTFINKYKSDWDALKDFGVDQEHIYDLFEANDYKYTINPTYEAGVMILVDKFVINLGVGGIYNGYFPFYNNTAIYQFTLGYSFGDVTINRERNKNLDRKVENTINKEKSRKRKSSNKKVYD